jgi:hypothetical protein
VKLKLKHWLISHLRHHRRRKLNRQHRRQLQANSRLCMQLTQAFANLRHSKFQVDQEKYSTVNTQQQD